MWFTIEVAGDVTLHQSQPRSLAWISLFDRWMFYSHHFDLMGSIRYKYKLLRLYYTKVMLWWRGVLSSDMEVGYINTSVCIASWVSVRPYIAEFRFVLFMTAFWLCRPTHSHCNFLKNTLLLQNSAAYVDFIEYALTEWIAKGTSKIEITAHTSRPELDKLPWEHCHIFRCIILHQWSDYESPHYSDKPKLHDPLKRENDLVTTGLIARTTHNPSNSLPCYCIKRYNGVKRVLETHGLLLTGPTDVQLWFTRAASAE